MSLVLTSLAVLSIGAIVSLALSRLPRVSLAVSTLAISIAAFLVVIASVRVLLGSADGSPREVTWLLPLGAARLALDALSAWFLMTIGVIALCVAIYTPAYMRPSSEHGVVPPFGALLCLLVASLVVVVCSADAVLFLAGWESMSLTAFFLVSSYQDRDEVRHGAWKYLVATHMGTALFVIPLFGVITALAETTAFWAFPSALASAGSTIAVVLFALGIVGFGVKAGILPMHVWLPAAHPVAPTPVSAFLSGVVVKTGIYGILRLLSWLPALPPACGYVLLSLGIISGVMGVLYALAQHDLKRLLAYHTVENIGIILIGIAVGMLGQAAHRPAVAVLGYAGALLHVTNHAVFKGLLFLSAGAVLHGSGTVEIERLGGLAKKTPVNALMFLLGAVAICGLPPLNGFVSEWVIYSGLFKGSLLGLRVVSIGAALGVLSLALMGGLALACFAKVFGVVFLGEARDDTVHTHTTPAAMKLSLALLAMVCVIIGLAPSLWVPLTYSAVSELTELTQSELAPSFEGTLALGSRLSLTAFVLVSLVAILTLVRVKLMGRATSAALTTAPTVTETWGCGYARPTARMQYTATSFASMLVQSFRGLLWPERKLARPIGVFPGLSSIETHVPDFADHDVLGPAFRYASRFTAMIRTVSWSGVAAPTPAHSEFHAGLRPLKTLLLSMVNALRRGAIHVHLLFIVLTLLALFLVEGFSNKSAISHPAVQRSENSVSAESQP